MNTDEAVKRWMKAYGNMNVASNDTFDVVLSECLHKAEGSFLIEFTSKLLQNDLPASSRAFLAAGVFEDLLKCESDIIDKLSRLLQTNMYAKDVLTYVWPNERMSAAGLKLLHDNHVI